MDEPVKPVMVDEYAMLLKSDVKEIKDNNTLLKERIDDITGAELGAYQAVGERLTILEEKIELILQYLKIKEEDNERT